MAAPWEKYAAKPWEKYGNVADTPQSPMEQLEAIQPSVKPSIKSPEPSWWEKSKGAGEAALTLGTGAIAAPIGALSGAGRALFGGQYGTQAGVRAGEKTMSDVSGAMTYQPRTEVGREKLAQASDVLGKSKLAGLGPQEAMMLGQIATPGARALRAGRAVPEIVPETAGKVARSVLPKVEPEIAELARKAEAAGIPLRPDMLTNSRVMKMVGDTLEKVPLSGAKLEERHAAFNQAVMDTIGADPSSKRLTPDVFRKAIESSGSTIGDISASHNIPVSGGLDKALQKHMASAEFETSDVSKVLNKYVTELTSKAKDGVIDGETFRKIRTDLTGRMRRTQSGDLKFALSELDDDLLDALQSQLTPSEIDSFNTARRQYSNAKVIEPMVAKSATGDISPSELMRRVTATGSGKSRMAKGKGGDLGDLARIGQRFLKEPPPLGVYGGMALGAGAVEGAILAPGATAATAGGMYGAANLYNRLGPSISRQMMKPPIGK